MRMRVYIDTSVVGGCLDEEFAEDSLRLFESARLGTLSLLVSDVVLRELEDAPPEVQRLLESLPETAVDSVPLTEEVLRLRDAYVARGIVGPKCHPRGRCHRRRSRCHCLLELPAHCAIGQD